MINPGVLNDVARAVPRILFLGGGGGGGGKLRRPLTGVFRIQTGLLVGRFCFHPYSESCL